MKESKLLKTPKDKYIALLRTCGKRITEAMIQKNDEARKLLIGQKEASVRIEVFVSNIPEAISVDVFKSIMDSINYKDQKEYKARGVTMDFAKISEILITELNQKFVTLAKSMGVENPSSIKMTKSEEKSEVKVETSGSKYESKVVES